MISAMQSDEFRNKHFWYLSNWGLYISTAYLLASGVTGTLQYGHLLRSDSALHADDGSGTPLVPTVSASPAAAVQQSATSVDDAAGGSAEAGDVEGGDMQKDDAGSDAVASHLEPTAELDSPASQAAEQAAAPNAADGADGSDVDADDTAPADVSDVAVEGALLSPTAAGAQSDEDAGATAPQQQETQPTASATAHATGAAEEACEGGLPLEPPLSEDAAWPSCSASCNGRTATQPSVLPSTRVFPHCNPTQSFWVHATIVFLFELAFSLGVGITLIYWMLLFDTDDTGRPSDLYRSVQTHVTLVIPVLECMLSRVPYSASHFPAMVGVGLFYVFVNGMYTVGNPGDELYSILTWKGVGSTLAVVVGVLALAIASFWGGRACTRTRDLLAARHLSRKQAV